MIVYLNQGQFIRKKKQGYQNFDIESIFRLKIPFNLGYEVVKHFYNLSLISKFIPSNE
jgi:hypothetical protein